jgi:hypothetical protein
MGPIIVDVFIAQHTPLLILSNGFCGGTGGYCRIVLIMLHVCVSFGMRPSLNFTPKQNNCVDSCSIMQLNTDC